MPYNEEEKYILKDCVESLGAIYSTAEITLSLLEEKGEISGYHVGGIMNAVKFHSHDVLSKLAPIQERLFEEI